MYRFSGDSVTSGVEASLLSPQSFTNHLENQAFSHVGRHGPGSLFPLAPSAVWSLVPPTLAPTPPHSTATANSTHAPRSSAIPGPPRRRSSVARDVSPRTVGTCTCPTPPPGSGSCHWSSAGTSRRTALLALGLGRPPPSEFDTACPRPAGRSSSDQADPPWPGRTVPALL